MELFYILLILLITARVFAEIAVRLGQPELFGEILAGVLLGVVLNYFTDALPILAGLRSGDNQLIVAIKDLGIFFLLLMGGIELAPKDMVKASKSGVVIALGGIIVPFLLAVWLGLAFFPVSDQRTAQILFIGTALSVTAVPVAIKVLLNMNRMATPTGRTIISAAIIDDILSLVLLAALTTVINTGSLPGGPALISLLLKVCLFFVITSAIGYYLFPAIGRFLKQATAEEFEFSMLLTAAFAYAVLAELLGMHFIIGAFQAGLFFRRQQVDRKTFRQVNERVRGLTNGFLAPVFFATVGLHLELSALLTIPGFVLLLIVTATLGKVAGAGIAARLTGFSIRDSAAVGMAMNARGAVELVIADIAMRAGLFSAGSETSPIIGQLFSAVVIMAIATTLMTPVALKILFKLMPDSS